MTSTVSTLSTFGVGYAGDGGNLGMTDMSPDSLLAYCRIQLDLTAYGCFMMGPSATADVEATLVHGAQGARSLNIFFLPRFDPV